MVIMVLSSMLLFMIVLLLVEVFSFRSWFSYYCEAIVFELFNLLSSELTSFFLGFRA